MCIYVYRTKLNIIFIMDKMEKTSSNLKYNYLKICYIKILTI